MRFLTGLMTFGLKVLEMVMIKGGSAEVPQIAQEVVVEIQKGVNSNREGVEGG